jgi:beta-glucosidase
VGTVEVPVSLVALGAWDPTIRRRVLPPASDVELEVGAHAHDPAAKVVPLQS